ncbi:hypothetical protein AVEN_54123-1 [Araneus ventricosus]|uniref:Uncharacterized protein n=1 Tax=Araneus ventricosus TaxID=182803 RepID=A0A4Y2BTH8_ARAVE|nr:hypothetical protein AVEN_54123-1 [Araneus ventricosus]
MGYVFYLEQQAYIFLNEPSQGRHNNIIIKGRYHAKIPNTFVILRINGRGGLVARSRRWGWKAPGPKPNTTKDLSCVGPVAHQIICRGQTPSRWCGVTVWRWDAGSGVVLVI